MWPSLGNFLPVVIIAFAFEWLRRILLYAIAIVALLAFGFDTGQGAAETDSEAGLRKLRSAAV